MTAAYVMVATLVHGTITVLGERGGRLLRAPSAMKTMRYVFSGLLFSLAVWFAWATRLLPE